MNYTEQNLQADTAALLSLVPEVEPFTFLVPMRVVSDIETAAATPKELLFGDDFMSSLNKAERMGLVLHEIWHVALCHMTDPYPAQDAKRANMAKDIVINQKIKDYVDKGYPFALPTGQGLYNPPLGWREEDKKYAGMSWQQVYELLYANHASNQQSGKSFDGHEVDPSQHTTMVESNATAACQMHDDIQANGRNASNQHGSSMDVVAAEHSKIPWQDKLRDVLTSVCVRGGMSWQRINRRVFATTQTYEPSRTQYEPKLPRTRILLDTSGSMYSVVGTALQDIAQILRTLNCMDVEVLLYDTAVCDTIPIVDNGYIIEDPSDWTRVCGGGGTSVRSALSSLEMLPVLTMVMTDGEDNLTASDLAVRPDIWMVYGYNTGDTGVTIHIED